MRIDFEGPKELAEYLYNKGSAFRSTKNFIDWLRMKADEDMLSISIRGTELPPDILIGCVPFLVRQHAENWGYPKLVYSEK